MVVAVASDRTLVLILPLKKEMYPLSTAALTRAQASRQELRNDYRDAYILDREGTVRQIEAVEVLGPWGETFSRKLLSRLTDAWSISVRLSEPLPWPLADLKRMLVDCLNSSWSGETGDPDEIVSLQEVTKAIIEASSSGAIVDALKLPPPEQALDVL